jgi:ATP-dependent RNA helicase HelY
MGSIWRDLSALEREMRVDFLRPMDLSFSGRDPLGVLCFAVGGPVRVGPGRGRLRPLVKQFIDLTEQVADAAGPTPLRSTARSVRAAAA